MSNLIKVLIFKKQIMMLYILLIDSLKLALRLMNVIRRFITMRSKMDRGDQDQLLKELIKLEVFKILFSPKIFFGKAL